LLVKSHEELLFIFCCSGNFAGVIGIFGQTIEKKTLFACCDLASSVIKSVLSSCPPD